MVPVGNIVAATLIIVATVGCQRSDSGLANSHGPDSDSHTQADMVGIPNVWEQQLIHQSLQDRQFRSTPLKEKFTIGDSDPSGDILYRPGGLMADSNGVYVFDYGDYRIKYYDLSGNLLLQIGNGTGEGPGEFYNPIDLSIGPEKKVYVLDSSLNRVSAFDEQGEYLESVNVEVGGTLQRMSVQPQTGDQMFIVFAGTSPMIVNTEEGVEVLDAFPKTKSIAESLLLNGYLRSTEDNGTIYVSSLYPIIVKMDSNYQIEYVRSTPDYYFSESGPQVEKPELPNLVPRSSYLNGPISVDEKYLYVLLRTELPDGGKANIDVYEVNTGSYKETIMLPFGTSYTSVYDGIMYSQVTDTSVTAYEFSF